MAARECLGIVGVGLIGGSIGLAARRTGRFGPILGVGRNLANLDRAVALGCIDQFSLDLASVAQRADVLVFCTPVDRIAHQALEAAEHCRPGTLLTDAGSTKAAIVAAVEEKLPDRVQFIGSHPLAGSEKQGAEHARADLFDGRLTIVTPTERTPMAVVERVSAFWQALGSRVCSMSPDGHDEALALTSHLPHLLAAALAGVLPAELRAFTASGFRDATRLAAGDPALWTAIFSQNAANVAAAVDRLRDRLDTFRTALLNVNDEMLEHLLIEAKKVRDDLGS